MIMTSWVRLDEILPLVEHALAGPAHRLTRAPALAGAPLVPALIRAAINLNDLAASHGYDKRQIEFVRGRRTGFARVAGAALRLALASSGNHAAASAR